MTIPDSGNSGNTLSQPQPDTSGTNTMDEQIRNVIQRAQRGRNSLIQTSYRGVLTDVTSLAPQRKNLLGE
jgi:hypothetical protein